MVEAAMVALWVTKVSLEETAAVEDDRVNVVVERPPTPFRPRRFRRYRRLMPKRPPLPLAVVVAWMP